ncbi:MAG TPA: OsmC family protein [Longimicrobiales bacterium]
MRLILEGEQRLRLQADGAGLEVESAEPGLQFSPLHMLAASLATCTVAVLVGWAERSRIPWHDLAIELTWTYVEDPYRVGRYDMTVLWPGLPPERQAAALRVAQHCTVEHTLRHPPEIQTRIEI